MGPIRIDENSTEKTLNEVFSLQKGEVFGVDPNFFSTFVERIPKDKFFKFRPLIKNSEESKYGKNCYKVICNDDVIILG